MLYLVIAVFSLHILVVPTVIRIKLDVDSDNQFGKITVKLFFIPVFIKKLYLEKFHDALNGIPIQDKEQTEEEREDEKNKKPSRFKRAVKDFLIGVALRIAKRIRVRTAELEAVIGMGDAAATAVAVSSSLILYCQACAFFGIEPSSGAIRPDYQAAKLFVKFNGIFSLCIGDIIYAVSAQILSKFARSGKGETYGKHTVTE